MLVLFVFAAFLKFRHQHKFLFQIQLAPLNGVKCWTIFEGQSELACPHVVDSADLHNLLRWNEQMQLDVLQKRNYSNGWSCHTDDEQL